MKSQKSGRVLILAYGAWLLILINVSNANTVERTKMTEGISKEELLRLKEAMPDGQSKLFIHLLIKKCTELDPWLPIDENTPKDVKLRLFYPKDEWNDPGTIEGKYQSYIPGFDYRKPTHYKLLPDDPK